MKNGAPIALADVRKLNFDKTTGLLPAIVQDADSGAVLMLGYMDRDALRETLDRKRVVFFSRSKQRLWEKGETSGNTLDLVAVWADCDDDTLLITAHPRGPACHNGTPTCFGDGKVTRATRLSFFADLEQVIEQRIAERPEGSYTARLFAQGPKRIAQKIGEEGVELALAGACEEDGKVVAEAADLLFHMLVLLKSRGLDLTGVAAELESRHANKTS